MLLSGHGLNWREKRDESAGAGGGVAGAAAELLDVDVDAATAAGAGSLASGVNGDPMARARLACAVSRATRAAARGCRPVEVVCTEARVRVALRAACQAGATRAGALLIVVDGGRCAPLAPAAFA